MPVKIMRPSAIGDQDNYTLIAGATKVIAVDTGDPVTHNDATSYIRRTDGQRQSFQTADVPVGAVGVVTTLKTGMRSRTASGENIVCMIRFNTTDGGAIGGTSTPNTWTTFGASVSSRPGGGSYVPSDLVNSSNAFQISCTAGGLTNNDVSSLWMELDYISKAGGFVSFIFEVLGPLVAVGLHEVPRLAAEVFRRSRGDRRIAPGEYAAVYQDLRDARHARSFTRSARGLWIPAT